MPAGHPHFVLVILYGRPFAVVRLARSEGEQPLGPEPKMAAALFDYKAKTHRVFTMPNDLVWFYQRMVQVQQGRAR